MIAAILHFDKSAGVPLLVIPAKAGTQLRQIMG